MRIVLVLQVVLGAVARLKHKVVLLRQDLHAFLVGIEHGSQEKVLASGRIEVVDQPGESALGIAGDLYEVWIRVRACWITATQ